MTIRNELSVFFGTDPKTYARYVRQSLSQDASSWGTKAKLRLLQEKTLRELEAERRQIMLEHKR